MPRSILAALIVLVVAVAPGRPSGGAVEAPPADPASPLDAAERDTLLQVAWRAIEARLASGAITDDDLEQYHFTPRLRQRRGCFVTLRTAGEVRGLQGEFEPARPLYQQVIVAARRAATRDPRFAPLALKDLAATTLEIAVIGEARTVRSPAEIPPGDHGLFLEKWGRRALLLPGAPAGAGPPDATLALDDLCRRASLPAGCWTAGARIEIFEVETVAGARPHSPPASSPTSGPHGARPDDPGAPPGGAGDGGATSGRGAGRRRAGRCPT